MRKSHLVQPDVGADHLVGDPGAFLAGTPDGGAVPDDLGKGGVEPYFEQLLVDGPLQAAAYVQFIRPEHHARIGREPQERCFRVVGPGEDALGVGGEDALGVQVAAVGDQPFGVGLAGVGEGILACEIVCLHWTFCFAWTGRQRLRMRGPPHYNRARFHVHLYCTRRRDFTLCQNELWRSSSRTR